MKKNYTLDIVSKTLTITKDFADKMADPKTAEYKLYKKLTKDIPNLEVVRKTHKTPTKYKTKSGEVFRNRNQYKNLTYERMEAFVKVFKNKPELKQNYDTVKLFAEASSKNGYAIVRDWFLTQFPEYRQNALYYLKNEVKVIDIISFLEKVDNKNNLKEVA